VFILTNRDYCFPGCPCFAHGGHGVGKSTTAAWAMLWFLIFRFPVKFASRGLQQDFNIAIQTRFKQPANQGLTPTSQVTFNAPLHFIGIYDAAAAALKITSACPR